MSGETTELSGRLERILFDQAEIRDCIASMGAGITRDYHGEPLTIIVILQGGALFMADLIREIHLPLRIDSITVASYHGGMQSSGSVTFLQDKMPDIEDRHVLLVDDILDTGRTISTIAQKLKSEGKPRSLKIAVLLKKTIERAADVEADYWGFEIGNEFVVGYGLDYQGEYRNLPMIGVLKQQFIERNE